MANTYTAPQISVAYDMDNDDHVLMATGRGGTAIVGERIFRAEPWPAVKFRHPTAEAAEADATTLRLYLSLYASGKLRDKEHGPRRRGWWED